MACSLFLISCTMSHEGEQYKAGKSSDSLSFQLEDKVMSVVKEFELSHPQYKELAIIPSDYFNAYEDTAVYTNGFMIGPAGENGIADGYNMVLHPFKADIYIKIYQKSIFKPSNMKIKNINPEDSAMIAEGHYYKYGWEYYILRSWLIYYDSPQQRMVVNKRPDTLFLPEVIICRDIKFE